MEQKELPTIITNNSGSSSQGEQSDATKELQAMWIPKCFPYEMQRVQKKWQFKRLVVNKNKFSTNLTVVLAHIQFNTMLTEQTCYTAANLNKPCTQTVGCNQR